MLFFFFFWSVLDSGLTKHISCFTVLCFCIGVQWSQVSMCQVYITYAYLISTSMSSNSGKEVPADARDLASKPRMLPCISTDLPAPICYSTTSTGMVGKQQLSLHAKIQYQGNHVITWKFPPVIQDFTVIRCLDPTVTGKTNNCYLLPVDLQILVIYYKPFNP